MVAVDQHRWTWDRLGYSPTLTTTAYAGALLLAVAVAAVLGAVGLLLRAVWSRVARLGARWLPASVAATLLRHGRPADRLQLEVTESVALADEHGAGTVLPALAELGVSLSVDDFGTGYSSLTYLQRRVFDEVKLDRSFVAGLVASPEDQAVVRAVVDLATGLRMLVVAEGVETAAQADLLRRLGCQYGQGYLFAAPLPARQAGALLVRPQLMSVLEPRDEVVL